MNAAINLLVLKEAVQVQITFPYILWYSDALPGMKMVHKRLPLRPRHDDV